MIVDLFTSKTTPGRETETDTDSDTIHHYRPSNMSAPSPHTTFIHSTVTSDDDLCIQWKHLASNASKRLPQDQNCALISRVSTHIVDGIALWSPLSRQHHPKTGHIIQVVGAWLCVCLSLNKNIFRIFVRLFTLYTTFIVLHPWQLGAFLFALL